MRDILKLVNAKKRNLTKVDKLAINHVGRQSLAQEIGEMERRAYDLGMLITARALNNALNALGWEMAGNFAEADKAARGNRHSSKRGHGQ
jgi:hypothetical protein